MRNELQTYEINRQSLKKAYYSWKVTNQKKKQVMKINIRIKS